MGPYVNGWSRRRDFGAQPVTVVLETLKPHLTRRAKQEMSIGFGRQIRRSMFAGRGLALSTSWMTCPTHSPTTFRTTLIVNSFPRLTVILRGIPADDMMGRFRPPSSRGAREKYFRHRKVNPAERGASDNLVPKPSVHTSHLYLRPGPGIRREPWR